ncbi:MAG: VOC family protein [Flavobacterium sp.]|nr:VOC family protein [Flavobacterium sp.]MBP8157064.1 VOC family protein [Flavobacterium sp.]
MKKLISTLVILSFFGITQAQEKVAFSFNHLALSVKSLDESATFYKEVLGLQEITNKTKIEGIRWFSFGEGKELHLVSILKEPVTVNKAVHLALSTADFDAFVKRLEAKHIVYSDWPGVTNKVTLRADGIKQIYFQDPDGYWIEVNSVAK